MGYLIGFCIIVAIIVFIVKNPIVWISLAIIVVLILFAVVFSKSKKKSSENEIKDEENKKIETTGHTDVPPIISQQQKLDVRVPEMIGGQSLVYYYNKIPFLPSESAEAEINKMKSANDWELNISISGDEVKVSHNEVCIGVVKGREDMIKDWMCRDDPLKVWLENFGDSGNYVFLAFYRDEQKRLESHENTIIKLTRCANKDAQSSMSGIQEGVKLDFDENYDLEAPDDTVFITYYGDAIGALPKKVAEKYLDEGAAAVFLDHIDYDYEKDKDIPYVKIYW